MNKLEMLSDYHYLRWTAIENLMGAKYEFSKGYDQQSWESLFEWAMALSESDALYHKLKPMQGEMNCLLRAYK